MNCLIYKLFVNKFNRTSTQVGNLQRELKQCKSQMAEQHKTLVEYSNRMDEYDKKNEETNRKFSTLLQVSVLYFMMYFGFENLKALLSKIVLS